MKKIYMNWNAVSHWISFIKHGDPDAELVDIWSLPYGTIGRFYTGTPLRYDRAEPSRDRVVFLTDHPDLFDGQELYFRGLKNLR